MRAGAASVMAPAVANPLYMGYKALYKTILEDSKRGIAKAMRVFADKDNLPVLIHCIHGAACWLINDAICPSRCEPVDLPFVVKVLSAFTIERWITAHCVYHGCGV